jgi:hypothetical protein
MMQPVPRRRLIERFAAIVVEIVIFVVTLPGLAVAVSLSLN